MGTFRRLFIGLTLISLFLLVAFAFRLQKWGGTLHKLNSAQVIEFSRGMQLTELAEILASRDIVKSKLGFVAYTRFFSDYSKLQAGSYRFVGNVSPDSVIRDLRNGKIYTPSILDLRIPEGFNIRQIIKRMSANKLGSVKDLTRLTRDKNFIKSLGVKAPSLEGYLYPATYSYTRMPTARVVFSQMVRTFFRRMPAGYEKSAREKKLSLHQAVTFASLIELETMIEDERTKIAEVIWSRIKRGEPIGIDAALIYGIKNYKGDIKWKHLKDKSNRYNTRIYKGLPPGPICSPTAASMAAVLKPTNQGYYYYVLVLDGKNRHHFSTTLKEHNKYVQMLKDKSKR